ncbi:MAG: DUF2341 domain-containing protein [Candidatus Peribacteraceae bacterium]|nr:DUF2341 domain-containing protein [Candidatus Peribacteraceae bacterium]
MTRICEHPACGIGIIKISVCFVSAITLCCGSLSPAHATSSWLNGWSYRQAITVDNAGMTATLTNFPLYVPLASDGAGAGIASKIQDTGNDIRFTSSDGATTLPYERESYSEASGNAAGNFWVGVTLNADNDAATDDTVYLYYGNTGAADGKDVANGTNDVWDSNFKGVWHLSGSTLSALDSTGNANDGTNNGATAATGKVGNGGSFDGTNDYISIPDSTSWDFGTGAFSVSMWFKKTSESRGDIFNKKSVDESDDVGLLLQDDETMDVFFKTDTVGDIVVSNGHVFTLNAWHYATMVRDGSSNLTTYIDAAADGSGTSGGNMNNNSADIWIGSNHDSSLVPSLPHTGLIDEIRISNVARSAAWISFEYNNMNQTGNALAFAAEEDAIDGWSYRKKITIDHTNVDAALTDFPLLVRIDQDTDFGTEAQSDGEDIHFTSSDGKTILPYERESWRVRAGSGSGLFWVKVPSVSNTTDTTIYAFYGNSSAADGQDATNVWDTNFKGVWHLKETATDEQTTSDLHQDSTSNNNDGDQTGNMNTTGKIFNAQDFDGTNDYVFLGNPASLNFSGTAARTISAWVNTDTVSSSWLTAVSGDQSGGGQIYRFQLDDTASPNRKIAFVMRNSAGNDQVLRSSSALSASTWYHIAGVYNGTQMLLYLNGLQSGTPITMTPISGDLAEADIGAHSGHDQNWNGAIDEVRISSAARSAAWVKFEYYNTGAVDNELAWSPEQDAVTGKSATTTTLASSDTTIGNGQSVTLTATLSPLTATGTATFKNGATTLGTVTLSHGSGSITVTDLAAGTHSLTAEYGGNAEFTTSTSAAVTQTVQGVGTWPYRKAITVDNTNVDSNLTNFPLLVKIGADTDIGGRSQNDGDDIRFALSNGTILPYEREDFRVRSGSGSGNFWVKVPTIKASGSGNGSGATIYLYYGSGAAANGEDATNVWDSNFREIYHFGSASMGADSTALNNDGTVTNVTSTTGKIGSAGQFNGSSTYIDNFSASLSPATSARTVCSWINTSSTTREGIVATCGNDIDGHSTGWVFTANRTTAGNLTYFHTGGGTAEVSAGITTNAWHYVCATLSSGTVTLFNNGSQAGSSTAGFSADYESDFKGIIGGENNVYGAIFTGMIDETRLSTTARSSAWLSFEYYNMGASDNELSWSGEQSAATGFAGDTTAPTLSGIASSVTSSSADITWTTNEKASSRVQYGTTSALGSATTEADTGAGVTSHSVTLSGLPVCTTYFYRPLSKDPSLNAATGSTLSFTTTGCTNSATVSSQTGSTVTTAGGSLDMTNGGSGATLSVPASAATNTFTLQIKKIDKTTVIVATSTPSGMSTIGDHTYDIRAISGATLVTSFLQPITVTMEYTDVQVSGYEESTLWIYRWDGSSWNALSSCSVDTSANTVTCTTTHFSTFGLFGNGVTTNAAAAATQGTGGRRGSTQDMAVRIAAARNALIARFEGKQRESRKIAAEEETKIIVVKPSDEDTASEREAEIAKRIEERKAEIARIERTKKEFEDKFALHREKRMANAVAQEKKKLADATAALEAEQLALKTEQTANEQRRAERLAEREKQDALEHAGEVLAAKERERKIAERIAARREDIARIERAKKEFEEQYALHLEERMAHAAAEEQKKLDEAHTALLAEQEALKEEQAANARRREERLAEQDAAEQEKAKAAAPSPADSLPVLAARRGRLYAVVNETPVLYGDVVVSAWYAPYVSYVVEEKIATGYADETGKPKGEFGVGNPVTYAEVLKMALNAAKKDMTSLPPPRNTSAQGTWAAGFVAQAEALSLSVFTPSLNVQMPASRGAVIQTILEVMGVPVANQSPTFSDVPANNPYARAIATASFYGLISGDTDSQGNALNTFRPEDPITRAEVSKIIALAKEALK